MVGYCRNSDMADSWSDRSPVNRVCKGSERSIIQRASSDLIAHKKRMISGNRH